MVLKQSLMRYYYPKARKQRLQHCVAMRASTNDRMIDAKSHTVKPDPVGHKTDGHYIVNASGVEAAWKGKGTEKRWAVIFGLWDLSISGSSLAILVFESTASLTMRNQRASATNILMTAGDQGGITTKQIIYNVQYPF